MIPWSYAMIFTTMIYQLLLQEDSVVWVIDRKNFKAAGTETGVLKTWSENDE